MLLEDKTAIIYGGGGGIGGGVARTFAREGAAVFLAGARLGLSDGTCAPGEQGGQRSASPWPVSQGDGWLRRG
jgi:NAD(P)-dependent dehydrogenase (short-subunit alcohol dehydrogenase family)